MNDEVVSHEKRAIQEDLLGEKEVIQANQEVIREDVEAIHGDQEVHKRDGEVILVEEEVIQDNQEETICQNLIEKLKIVLNKDRTPIYM